MGRMGRMGRMIMGQWDEGTILWGTIGLWDGTPCPVKFTKKSFSKNKNLEDSSLGWSASTGKTFSSADFADFSPCADLNIC